MIARHVCSVQPEDALGLGGQGPGCHLICLNRLPLDPDGSQGGEGACHSTFFPKSSTCARSFCTWLAQTSHGPRGKIPKAKFQRWQSLGCNRVQLLPRAVHWAPPVPSGLSLPICGMRAWMAAHCGSICWGGIPGDPTDGSQSCPSLPASEPTSPGGGLLHG